MNFRRWSVGVALAIVVVGGACGRQGSEINEIGLIYEGGAIQEKTFRGILPPGSTYESVGWGSTVYRYRIDQRSYIANARGQGADEQPVQVVSEDDVRLRVDYQLYFKLNQEEKVLRKFHENIGVKTEAWTDQGWIQMLREYFAPQIERAMEAAALKHKWRDLYASEEARVAFQDETVARLKENIREVIGDDYFCGPAYSKPGDECGAFTFTVGKPEPVSEGIVQAIESEQQAVAKTIAQEQENLRIAKELEAERFLVELYGAQGALLREAIRSGKVTQIILDPNGRIAVAPASPAP